MGIRVGSWALALVLVGATLLSGLYIEPFDLLGVIMQRITVTAIVVCGVLLTIASFARISNASAPAQPGTYYQTFTGADLHPLGQNPGLLFAGGTGGGVWFHSFGSPGSNYLEAGVNLPSGAQISEVAYYYRNCTEYLNNQDWPRTYFGAYTPSTGHFAYFLPEAAAPNNVSCTKTLTLTRPVVPAVTVDNSLNRYVIGYNVQAYFDFPYGQVDYNPQYDHQLFAGARVTYQLPGVFLPVVQR